MQNLGEPEGLYPNYRKKTTLQICELITKGISFKIEGESGVGKSKYLRYLTTSPTIQNEYWEPNNIKICYIDLNLLYQNTTEAIMETIKQKLEMTLNVAITKFNHICLVIDHAERLLEFEEKTIRYLRALIYENHHKLQYIFAYEVGFKAQLEKIKYIETISPTKMVLGPLNRQETVENIIASAKNLGLTLSNKQINEIADATGGFAKSIKQILDELKIGKDLTRVLVNLKQANQNLQNTPNLQNSLETKSIDAGGLQTTAQIVDGTNTLLSAIIRHCTKKEYLVFKAVYEKKGEIVTKDQIAEILSPDSNGDGVSDESIDQLISRLRKSIRQANLTIQIKTKRGVGYYID